MRVRDRLSHFLGKITGTEALAKEVYRLRGEILDLQGEVAFRRDEQQDLEKRLRNWFSKELEHHADELEGIQHELEDLSPPDLKERLDRIESDVEDLQQVIPGDPGDLITGGRNGNFQEHLDEACGEELEKIDRLETEWDEFNEALAEQALACSLEGRK